nr:ABC transporter permease subunit [Cohnella zeiphila]
MEKLWMRRRTKAFLLSTVLLPALGAAALSSLQSGTAIGFGLGSDLPMLMLGLFTTLLLPLFLFMAAVDSFTGEFASRTIKLVLTRPISRSKAFASKVLALAVLIAVSLGAVWLASAAAELLSGGGLTGSGLIDGVVAYASAFLPMLAVALMSVLLAQRFHNSAGALGLIVLVYVLAKLLPFLFPSAAVWSVYSYTNWYSLWIGGGVPSGKLLNTTLLLFSYCVMAYMGGLMQFERKRF